MSPEFEREPLHEESPPRSWRVPLIGVALAVVAVVAGVVWLSGPDSQSAGPPPPAQLPPLSPEAEAYLAQIEISGLALSRWENFLGQAVTYLDATLHNRGSRTIVALELTIEFLDTRQAVVRRETLRPIGAARRSPGARRVGPLKPGETASFRGGFEEIPASWDGGLPRVRITGLLLQ